MWLEKPKLLLFGKIAHLLRSAVYPLNHGWVSISLIPFSDPILWFGFFASNPLINDFTSFDTEGDFGNLGSEFNIAKKISYFFGA